MDLKFLKNQKYALRGTIQARHRAKSAAAKAAKAAKEQPAKAAVKA